MVSQYPCQLPKELRISQTPPLLSGLSIFFPEFLFKLLFICMRLDQDSLKLLSPLAYSNGLRSSSSLLGSKEYEFPLKLLLLWPILQDESLDLPKEEPCMIPLLADSQLSSKALPFIPPSALNPLQPQFLRPSWSYFLTSLRSISGLIPQVYPKDDPLISDPWGVSPCSDCLNALYQIFLPKGKCSSFYLLQNGDGYPPQLLLRTPK